MYRQDVPTIGSVACSSDPTAALRASVVLCPWPPCVCPPGPSSLRSSGNCPGPAWLAMSAAPRRAASAGIAPALRAVTIPAWPRTTFRCVAGEPTRSAPSPLRGSPHPGADARLRAMSCRPDRDAFGPASRPSCPPYRHVAAFRTNDPPATLDRTPSAFQQASRFAETPVHRRSPGIARDVASAPVLESATLDTRSVAAVTTPPERSNSSPAVPAADFCRNPDDGICRQKTSVPKQREALFLSPRGTPSVFVLRTPPRQVRNAPASFPSRTKCSAVVYADCAALERRPIAVPRSSAAKGTRGHAP